MRKKTFMFSRRLRATPNIELGGAGVRGGKLRLRLPWAFFSHTPVVRFCFRFVLFRAHRGKIDGSSFVGDSFVVVTSVVKKMCLSPFAGGLAALEYRIATFARDTRTATSRPVLSPMTHIAQSARDPVDCRLDTRRCNSK